MGVGVLIIEAVDVVLAVGEDMVASLSCSSRMSSLRLLGWLEAVSLDRRFLGVGFRSSVSAEGTVRCDEWMAGVTWQGCRGTLLGSGVIVIVAAAEPRDTTDGEGLRSRSPRLPLAVLGRFAGFETEPSVTGFLLRDAGVEGLGDFFLAGRLAVSDCAEDTD